MSKTKKRKTLAKKPTVKKQTTSTVKTSGLDNWATQDFSIGTLGLFVLVIAMIHFAYSFASNGFYQGEEGIHYMNMKKFWHQPSAILGNWGKPGWKLLYVIPAVGGITFLNFYNGLISALSGFVAYKIAKMKGAKLPILAFILLAGQFFWMEMAFRNYSELITALLIVSAVYFHLNENYIPAALLLSYTLIMRQELLPVVGLYALYLLFKKKAWIPVLCMGIFPFLINLWGAIETGDPFYSLTNAMGVASTAADRYPRHGFDHYYKVALPIYGPLIIIGFLGYLKLVFNKERKLDYFIFLPFAILFTIYCLFNFQAIKIGTSTAGNWRYLLMFSPLLAIMATLGWDKLQQSNNKIPYLLLFVPYLLYAAVYTSFDHNYIGFSTVKNWILPITVALSIGLAMLPLSRGQLVGGMAILAIGFNYFYLKPIKRFGEDKTMQELAVWVEKESIDEQPIYYSNQMLNVFMDRNPHEFPNGMTRLRSVSDLERAKVGSYVFWDTHYTERESKIKYQYLQQRPNQYQLIKQEQSNDKRFAMLIFQKIK